MKFLTTKQNLLQSALRTHNLKKMIENAKFNLAEAEDKKQIALSTKSLHKKNSYLV